MNQMPESSSRENIQEELSFEEAFDRLGETVQALESGGLTLESATNLYEDGMQLVKLCNRLLSEAELKVTQLKDVYSERPAHTALDGFPSVEEEAVEE